MQGALKTAVLALLLVAVGAQAETGRERLEKWCRGESSAGSGTCLGYLLAAEEALAGDSIEGLRACLPPDLTLKARLRILSDWLHEHPEHQTQSALGLVVRAYAARYPCSK